MSLCLGHSGAMTLAECPVCLVIREKEEMRAALAGLMRAHREVFRTHIFTAFRAGKTSFNNAWKQAEKYVPATGESKETK